MVTIRADVGAESVGVAQFLEQGYGVVFDGGFVEGASHNGMDYLSGIDYSFCKGQVLY